MHHFDMALLRGHIQWGGHPLGPVIGGRQQRVCSRKEELPGRLQTPVLSCQVERRNPGILAPVDVGAFLDKQSHDPTATSGRSKVERCMTAAAHSIQI